MHKRLISKTNGKRECHIHVEAFVSSLMYFRSKMSLRLSERIKILTLVIGTYPYINMRIGKNRNHTESLAVLYLMLILFDG